MTRNLINSLCFWLACCAVLFTWPLLYGCGGGGSPAEAQSIEYRSSVAMEGIALSPTWQTIRSWDVPQDGVYLILYNVRVINNEHYNILSAWELRVDDVLLETCSTNISSDTHYGQHAMSWVGQLYEGEIIHVDAKADSTSGMRALSAIVPWELEGHDWEHESMSIIRVEGFWYQSGRLLP